MYLDDFHIEVQRLREKAKERQALSWTETDAARFMESIKHMQQHCTPQ